MRTMRFHEVMTDMLPRRLGLQTQRRVYVILRYGLLIALENSSSARTICSISNFSIRSFVQPHTLTASIDQCHHPRRISLVRIS